MGLVAPGVGHLQDQLLTLPGLHHIVRDTHTHTHKKTKSLAAAKQLHRSSEILGYLGITQALRPSAGKST